jgi:hypothetical protein
MVEKIKTHILDGGEATRYLYSIDKYEETDTIPELQCEAPCYTCLDANPNFCMSCWGEFAGTDSDGNKNANEKYFLQQEPGG